MKTKFLFIGIAVGAVQVLFAQPETEVQKLLSIAGESSDRFGKSVSISGKYAIVGASGEDRNGPNTGAAYIYHRHSTHGDQWSRIATLAPENGSEEDHFGASVSISGAYAIVGAHGDDDRGNESGSGYIFYRDEGGADNWGLVTKLTALDGAADDRFGYSVSLSGDHAIVGAFENCENGYMSGAAYIFYHNQEGPDQWGEVKKLMAADGSELDHFGFSVAISGFYAIVGSYGDEDNGVLSGSAYIYYKDLDETDGWGECAKITASDGESYSFFGTSVGISDELAIVGAYKHNDSLKHSGAAYIFHKDQNGSGKWGQQAKLKANNPSSYDYFGWSTSISEEYAIVGAYNDDDLGSNSGSVYIFSKDPDIEEGWNQAGKLTASDGAEKCNFGKSVSLSGNYAFVGSSSTSAGINSGAVYIFGPDDVCIYEQPEHQVNVCNGSEVSFSITGANIDNYQWQESCDAGISWTNLTDSSNYDGTSLSILTVIALADNDHHQYRCMVSNDQDQTTSNPALLMIDTVAPILIPRDITVFLDTNGTCNIVPEEVVAEVWDNCNLSDLSLSQSIFDCSDIGIIAIEVTLSDVSGNETTETAWVTVIDSIMPTVSCKEKITVDADQLGSYIVQDTELDVVISCDNCNRFLIDNDLNHSPSLKGASFSPGTTVVNWTVDDGTGYIQTMMSKITVNHTVGINGRPEISFKVYPNPTDGIFKLDGVHEMVKTMVITDLSGVAVIKKGAIHQGEILDISVLKPGAYILTLYLDGGSSIRDERTRSITIIKK